MTEARPLAEINNDINANHRALKRSFGKFDVLSAAAWGAAWDANPDLYERDKALIQEWAIAYGERKERYDAKRRARMLAKRRVAAKETKAARQLVRDAFEGAIKSAADPSHKAKLQLVSNYLFNPRFRLTLEDQIWSLNQGAA